MRQISEALEAKLRSGDFTGLTHKLLLYRRKWNGGKYIIEEKPIDITDALNHKNSNVVINQQLDTEIANVWEAGNLNLTLHNENNRLGIALQ